MEDNCQNNDTTSILQHFAQNLLNAVECLNNTNKNNCPILSTSRCNIPTVQKERRWLFGDRPPAPPESGSAPLAVSKKCHSNYNQRHLHSQFFMSS